MAPLDEAAAPPLDPTMLGRLLVIQQAVDAMPDEAHIAAFLSRALAGLPGVAEAYVDFDGHAGRRTRPWRR